MLALAVKGTKEFTRAEIKWEIILIVRMSRTDTYSAVVLSCCSGARLIQGVAGKHWMVGYRW